MTVENRLELCGAMDSGFERVLTPEALEFLAELEHRFGPRRRDLLDARIATRARLRAGEMLDFLADTRDVRAEDWHVAPAPPDLRQRWVEITGPTDRKMIINALNSGADGFMADFEDANAPTWRNMVTGHINLRDAIDGAIAYDGSDGRHYELSDEVATLIVRPRGWHLPERHVLVDGAPITAALFDFGLFFFHCARPLMASGSGPYLYLPKMESYLEARLWNDVFCFSQDAAGIERGTIKATVLIETLPAAFEMDEILYELRDHSAGLNAGRWDYIFSSIKCFADRADMVLPDRSEVTMTVPFMRAYTELLAATCHRRGAHALGGMADPDLAVGSPRSRARGRDAGHRRARPAHTRRGEGEDPPAGGGGDLAGGPAGRDARDLRPRDPGPGADRVPHVAGLRLSGLMGAIGERNLAVQAERSYQRKGDYEALLFEGTWHRSGELFERSRRLAAGIAGLGVGPGERVVVTMGNSPDVGIAYQALWRAGTVVTPANFLLPAEDLRHVIADAQAAAVITTEEFADKVSEASAGLGHVRHTISTGEVQGFMPVVELERAEPAGIVPRADDELAA